MKKNKQASLIHALKDPKLFGPWFTGSSWQTWLVVLKVFCGLDLEPQELDIYRKITERQTLPALVRQLWIIAGRRSGKSLIAALLGVWHAVFKDWKPVLTRGETGLVVTICPDKAQARITFNYAKAFCEDIPIIKSMVAQITAESITFTNGIRLEIRTASYRTVRGYSVVCAIIDEAAFLRDESSANPFGEILTALRPSMATTGGLLVVISTPYARTGEFWNAHQRYFGKENPNVLFVKGPTQVFNPTVPAHVIEDAFAEDPAAAGSEFGSLEAGISFRADVETFIPLEAVQAVIIPGRLELGPLSHFRYQAFCDPSGGSNDSFTLGIAHSEKNLRFDDIRYPKDTATYREAKEARKKQYAGKLVLDLVREVRPPFSPESVIEEFCGLLKTYRIYQIEGDRYAGEWPREQFRKHGIRYVVSTKS